MSIPGPTNIAAALKRSKSGISHVLLVLLNQLNVKGETWLSLLLLLDAQMPGKSTLVNRIAEKRDAIVHES